MHRYVVYVISFVAYLFVLIALSTIVKPFIGFFIWLLSAFLLYYIADNYGRGIPWIQQLLEDIESIDIKTYESSLETGKKATGSAMEKTGKSVKYYSNKISVEMGNYTENFNQWRAKNININQSLASTGNYIQNFSFNSTTLYKVRLWLFLIFVPLITWIVMWDIVSWPFQIWFGWWFAYEDAFHLSNICSLILSYFIIIRIYSHCTNNRNLPIHSEIMSDVDPYVVSHLFRIPKEYESMKLTVKATFLDFIGGYLILIFTSAYALLFFDQISGSDFNDFVAEGYFSLLLAILSIAILVPIMEELMFRGFVLDVASEAYSRWVAIIISAILFALIHPLYPLSVLNAFWAGIIYGYLRIRTNSLWPPILLHSLWNAHIILLQFYEI